MILYVLNNVIITKDKFLAQELEEQGYTLVTVVAEEEHKNE